MAIDIFSGDGVFAMTVPQLSKQIVPRVRRIALWLNELNDDYLQAFRSEGVEIVALLQATHPQVSSFTVHDLFYGNDQLSQFAKIVAPADWIDNDSYRQYALCVHRMGFFPGSTTMDTHSGGIYPASELEDWARVHLNHALRLLEGTGADEVWFGFTPHLGVDNMLALAALKTGRKCLVFQQSRSAPKFTCRQLGAPSSHQFRELGWKPWEQGATPPNLFYMRDNLNPNRWHGDLAPRLRLFFQQLRAFDRAGVSQRMHYAASRRGWWWLCYLLELTDARTRGWAWQRKYSRKQYAREREDRDGIRDLATLGKFVYFPLQYEPEENVHVLGDNYRNQLDAVIALHQALPEGWSLAIKENPMQTWQHRGVPYHLRLRDLDRVKFIHSSTPSLALINAACLVATITGTAGYEALLAGKPCVYFGNPWYKGLPGTVQFVEGIDLSLCATTEIEQDALDQGVNALFSGMADGLIHPRYANIHAAHHHLPDLYREAVRSMLRISASLA